MTASQAITQGVRAMWAGLAALDPLSLTINLVLTAAVIGVALVGSRLGRLAVRRCVRRLPGPRDAERTIRMRRIVRLAQAALNVVLSVGAAATVAAIWGASAWFLGGPGGWLLRSFGRFVITIALTATAFEAASFGVHQLMSRLIRDAEDSRRAAQLRTLAPLLVGICQTTILIVGGLTLLSQAGVKIGPLLAGAGVIGIAVGFGAQSLVKDVLTGIFLIAEDIVSIGDVVQVGDSSGVVEQMTLRTIRLRGLDGTLHILPYGEAQTVHNMTKTFAYYVFDLQISYEAGIDRAVEIIRRTGAELMAEPEFAARILEPIEVLGVDSLGDSGVVLKARFKTKPIEQWTVGREYNRRIKLAFDREGIEIPYPHMKVVLPAEAEEAARH